jgi:diguanylate cyclase (GGDEF)-like protein
VAGLAFYFTALVGLHVGLPGTGVSPVWLASGVALAAVLLYGRRVLVGVWIAAVLAQLTVGTPLGVSAAQGFGDVLEALIAAQALFFFCGRQGRLLHLRDVIVLLAFGVGVGAVVGATVGVAALVVGAGLPSADVWNSWFTWWLGDANGLILITPLIVYLAGRPHGLGGTRRLAEGGAFLLLIGAMGCGAFWGVFSGRLATPLQYLLFVVLVVIAFRFGPRLTTVSTNLLAIVAVLAAVNGLGPFILGSQNESLLYLQTAMIGLGVTGLLLGIIVNERQLALREVETARDSLEETVRRRTVELEELASRDGLTGLANRRAFNEALARAVPQAARGHAATLLFGDLDGFKQCNDTRGHAFGDAMLVEVAALLHGVVRQGDLVARIGGDEFGLLLDGAGPSEALDVGARVEAGLAGLSEKVEVPISMSLGLVVVDGSRGVDAVLSIADEAMYRAKAGGGGQVVRLPAEDDSVSSAQHPRKLVD